MKRNATGEFGSGQHPELQGRIVRVETLEDGKTIHNAFADRNFGPPETKWE